MKAITFPGGFMCGSCGSILSGEKFQPGATSVVVMCGDFECAEKGIRYLLPATVIELERAVQV